MAETLARRNLYDSVFTDLFSSPENQLLAYQALHPEDHSVTEKDITDVTLKAIFVDQMYNDLGFTIGDKVIMLVEGQSTWSNNIAIRSLMYLAHTFEQYLKRTKQNYYAEKAVQLPKPELYMLYTGDKLHEEEEISLAGIHWNGDDSVLNVKVRVIYADQTNSILTQYISFTQIYKKYRAIDGATETAVVHTIDECIQ